MATAWFGHKFRLLEHINHNGHPPPLLFAAPTPQDAYRDGTINRWQFEQLEGPLPPALQGPRPDVAGAEAAEGPDQCVSRASINPMAFFASSSDRRLSPSRA